MFQVQTIFVYFIALVLICTSFLLDATVLDGENMIIKNLNSTIITKHNVILTWMIDNSTGKLSENFETSLGYKSGCNYAETKINITDEISRTSNVYMYAFEEICPNNLNRITLYISASGKNYSEHVVFTTMKRKPAIAPIVDVGSFFIDKNDTVYIYWKKIDSSIYYGGNFAILFSKEIKYQTFQLIYKQENEKELTNSLVTSAMVCNATLGAKLKIQAINEVGVAEKASYLEIPSKDRLCRKPENIQVYKLENDYHVSWTKPIGDYNITSYTVFWCTSYSKSSAQCDASINFETVTGSLQFSLKSSDRQLKFAVSANTVNSTSGMTWMECLAETDSTQIGRIESFQNITISTNKIEFQWTPKCNDTLIVKNYIVEYCSVEKRDSDCIKTFKPQVTNTTTYSLDNLKSSTMYRINVTMKSATTMGPSSNPEYFTTADPLWKQFIPYIMLGVFLFITSGISVYWSYCKLTRMKNIKVNIPFGLDLDKDNDQKKSIRQHPAFFASTERLGVIPEIDSLDIVSAQSSMVASMNSSRKGSLQSQHSDATAVIQEDVIQLDPTLGSSLYTGNFIIHPVLDTESSPTLVQPSYSREPSNDEPTNNSDYKSGLYDPRISTNGYVCLHNIASKVKGYTPMAQLASKPKPRVIPDHGSYVDMNRLSQSY